MIIEILEHEKNVTDAHSAAWFLQDLAREQDAADSLVVEDLKTLTMGDTPFLGSQYAVSVAVGRMAVSKGRQGAEAKNVLRVYLANIRLPNTNSDILVTVYEPLLISEQSETARVLGAGIPVSAESAGVVPASEIFRVALSTFQINDWGLFGHP
ncbi:hypothetical protein KP509_1Z035400 [Ceratopteris richardii]|nr:hypothetical protein KP509_1Z035400 [Ceratopteris richardii]KAH6558968.1 hypothetical protein KP509_1Z035400 [Ceratopteris richardii]